MAHRKKFTFNAHGLRRFRPKNRRNNKLYKVGYHLPPDFIISFDGHFSEVKQTAGWGFVVQCEEEILHRAHGKIDPANSNSHRAEWRACLEALLWITKNANEAVCELRGDSQSVIDTLLGVVDCADERLEAVIATARKLWSKLPFAYALWIQRQQNAAANAECRKVRLTPEMT